MGLYEEILSDTPSRYWPLDGNLDDATGTSDLVLANGSTGYVSDSIFGEVVDATLGDWIIDFRVPQTTYTIEALVYFTSTHPGNDETIVADWGGNDATGVMLWKPSDSGYGVFHKDVNHVGTITPRINEWDHLVATWNGTLLKLYVNGVLDFSVGVTVAPGTASGSGTASRINNYGPSVVSRRMTGHMAHVAWYSTVLSAARVTAHYDAIAETESVLIEGLTTIGYIYENVGLHVVDTQEAHGQIYENISFLIVDNKEAYGYVNENVGVTNPNPGDADGYIYEDSIIIVPTHWGRPI